MNRSSKNAKSNRRNSSLAITGTQLTFSEKSTCENITTKNVKKSVENGTSNHSSRSNKPKSKRLSLPISATDTGFSDEQDFLERSFDNFSLRDFSARAAQNNDKSPPLSPDEKSAEIRALLNDSINDDKYHEIFEYLEEVNKSCRKIMINDYINEGTENSREIISGSQLDSALKFEDLEKFTPAELKNEVINLNFSVNEKNSAIFILQKELLKVRKEMQEIVGDNDKVLSEKLKEQRENYEKRSNRHEKQIDRLNKEKRKLETEKESLERDAEALKNKLEANLKAAEHKFNVGVRNAKETFERQEKIKREKWMEAKTRQIKEMTIRGIEPEIEALNRKHELELEGVRKTYKSEIESFELIESRKIHEKCQELRDELEARHELELSKMSDSLQRKFEQNFEKEKDCWENEKLKLQSDFVERIASLEAKEQSARSGFETLLKEKDSEWSEHVERINRNFQNEIKILLENKDKDFELWRNKFIKDKAVEILQHETNICAQMQKDKQIEIQDIKNKFEHETLLIKAQYEQINENRIKRITEKYDKDIEELEKSENNFREKSNELKEKLIEQQETISKLIWTTNNLENECESTKQANEKLEAEKNRFKELAEQSYQRRIDELKDMTMRKKAEFDVELKHVYERAKIAIQQKDEILIRLRNDNVLLVAKCAYLEKMLDKQRQDYFLNQTC